MINFRNARYIKSAPDINYSPTPKLDEIIFVGKSNVGKSTLINLLCDNKNLAKTSSTPGATKYLNYFNIDNKFYLIDAPGYGFVSDKKLEFTKTMDSIFSSEKIKGVIFILDARRKLTVHDKVFYNFLIDKNLPFILVLNKEDKISQKEKALILKDIKKNFVIVKENEIVFTSNKNKLNIDLIRKYIVTMLNYGKIHS